ncbi:hypothetical protein AB0B30_11070 [Streptomyces narbonensis]|uniref:Uncharacterized protein n=1 Tax=Streptomyces narbonensis TaxID=67333 RepID=A0ABV3C5A5_9ACTN
MSTLSRHLQRAAVVVSALGALALTQADAFLVDDDAPSRDVVVTALGDDLGWG